MDIAAGVFNRILLGDHPGPLNRQRSARKAAQDVYTCKERFCTNHAKRDTGRTAAPLTLFLLSSRGSSHCYHIIAPKLLQLYAVPVRTINKRLIDGTYVYNTAELCRCVRGAWLTVTSGNCCTIPGMYKANA